MDLSRVNNYRDANAITRAYFDSILIESRYLDSNVADLRMKLYGQSFSSPVMIAAFSHLNGYHPDGMVEMARGAELANVCNWAGMGDDKELKDILDTGAGSIKIIKPYADRKRIIDKLHFARENGAIAVGIDIDHGFDRKGRPDIVLGNQMEPLTSDELRELVQEAKIPFVVKGVLSVHDAVKCAEAGVRGIVISHHHGIMPYAIPPLMALPRISSVVGKSMDLFVDCGIATGSDVFKCLALGAKAVCVGNAILPSFKAKGAVGIKEYIDTMNDELSALMARTCSLDLDHIPNDVLWSTDTCMPL